jgi:hypothetical protein
LAGALPFLPEGVQLGATDLRHGPRQNAKTVRHGEGPGCNMRRWNGGCSITGAFGGSTRTEEDQPMWSFRTLRRCADSRRQEARREVGPPRRGRWCGTMRTVRVGAGFGLSQNRIHAGWWSAGSWCCRWLVMPKKRDSSPDSAAKESRTSDNGISRDMGGFQNETTRCFVAPGGGG